MEVEMATLETVEHPTVEVAPAQAPDSTPPAPQTETRPPRLSEALRYGQMNVEQALGTFVDIDGKMCALGTIWYGMGYDVSYADDIHGFVRKNPEWGFLVEPVTTVPLREGVCSSGCIPTRCIADVVMHWNDQHEMPRNEIADRLSQFGL